MTDWDQWNAHALEGISPESRRQAAKLFPNVPRTKKKVPTAKRHLNPDEFDRPVEKKTDG